MTNLNPVLTLLEDTLAGADIDISELRNAIVLVQNAINESISATTKELDSMILRFDDYLPGGKYGPPAGGPGGRAA